MELGAYDTFIVQIFKPNVDTSSSIFVCSKGAGIKCSLISSMGSVQKCSNCIMFELKTKRRHGINAETSKYWEALNLNKKKVGRNTGNS